MTNNRVKSEMPVSFIPTNVSWNIPNDGTPYRISVPIENMRDDLNFDIHPDVTITIVNILPGGYELDVTVPDTVVFGTYNLTIINPGGMLNSDLQLGLADNGVGIITVSADPFHVAGNDIIDIYHILDGQISYLDKYVTLYDVNHFLEAVLVNWSASFSGTGSTIEMNQLGEEDAPGIARPRMGTSGATRRSGCVKRTNVIQTMLNSRYTLVKFRQRVETLSTDVDQYVWHIGFINSNSNINFDDGIAFVYDRSNVSGIGTITPVNWHLVSRVNGVVKATIDTGIPVTLGTFNDFMIMFTPATKRVYAYINGVLVAQILWNGNVTAAGSNLPMVGVGTESSVGWGIYPGAGAAGPGFRIDHVTIIQIAYE
jgi:hypothetical protein